MSAAGSDGSVSRIQRVLRIACWICIALVAAYTAIVIYAYPHDHEQHVSDATVLTINARRLNAGDVAGTNLPPPPDPHRVDATVTGIDANNNGIRDDVELKIFARYPTSSATSTAVRAAEMQYAMDLQTLLADVFDSNTWQAAIVQRERGFGCLYDSSSGKPAPLETEVDSLVLNTPDRIGRSDYAERYRASYKLASGPDCDVIRK